MGRVSGCVAMVVVGVLSVALLVFGLYVYAGGPLPSPHLLH